MKKFIALAAIALASASSFAFQSSDSFTTVKKEVIVLAGQGKSISDVIALARKAGVSAITIQNALIAAKGSFSGGSTDVAIFDAMVTAGFDVGDLLPASAAGGTQGGQVTGGTFSGFSGSSGFSQSRSSTVGGGGRTSVSRS